MTMQNDTDIAPEAAEYRVAYRFLLDHAGWPTPPSAWAQLFMATAALGEVFDPAPPPHQRDARGPLRYAC